MPRIVLGIAAMVLVALLGILSLRRPPSVEPQVKAPLRDAATPDRVELIVAPPAPAPAPAQPAPPSSELSDAAIRGDVTAQSRLCETAMNQGAISSDYSDAAQWCSLAADNGDAESQSAYARLFQLGAGVAMDEQAAEEWYEKAAQQDNAHAMYMLGQMLVGRDVAADHERGVAMLQRAAVLGDANARWELQKQGVAPEEKRGQQLLTQPDR
jgi:TPR repeat protein